MTTGAFALGEIEPISQADDYNNQITTLIVFHIGKWEQHNLICDNNMRLLCTNQKKTCLIAISRPILRYTFVGKSKLLLKVSEWKDGFFNGIPQLRHTGLVVLPEKEIEKTYNANWRLDSKEYSEGNSTNLYWCLVFFVDRWSLFKSFIMLHIVKLDLKTVVVVVRWSLAQVCSILRDGVQIK
jgi:hypothetical protein